MLQAAMMAPGKIVFQDTDIPILKDGQVLVHIKRIGICGSDIHVYHGKHPFTTYPVVQGHEVSGEIVKISPPVKSISVGDKVTVQPQVFCRECYPCTHDQYHICDNLKVMGFQTTGMASEYFAVDSDKVLRLPDHMSFEEGALVEPTAVVCHALGRSSVKVEGKKVLILGAGPIGNLTAQVAIAKDAGKVMITDISDYRLKCAEDCGIHYTVNTKQKDLKDAIEDHFGSDKADLILDCAGNQSTVNDAVSYARKGTQIIMVAVIPDEVKINMGLIQDRELKIIGTLMYMKQDYIEAISVLSSNKIKTRQLITHFFDFKDYDLAYQLIEREKDKVMKVMIKMPDKVQ